MVVFMVCLAIAGSIVAGVHYYTVDLPAQKDIRPPQNYNADCHYACFNEEFACVMDGCSSITDDFAKFQCQNVCGSNFIACDNSCESDPSLKIAG
jgi:hypothetical protein